MRIPKSAFVVRVLVVFGLIVPLLVLPFQSASAAGGVGVNLNWYCRTKYSYLMQYQYVAAYQSSPNASGWRCQIGGGPNKVEPLLTKLETINMIEACSWQYPGHYNYGAQPLNWSDPYSWRCYWAY